MFCRLPTEAATVCESESAFELPADPRSDYYAVTGQRTRGTGRASIMHPGLNKRWAGVRAHGKSSARRPHRNHSRASRLNKRFTGAGIVPFMEFFHCERRKTVPAIDRLSGNLSSRANGLLWGKQ